MLKPINQRAALITGASSGIGRAVAKTLAGAGVKVLVTARRQDRLDELVAEIAAAGGKASAIAGTITDEVFARSLVTQTVKTYGSIDILVNSAGTIQFNHWEKIDTEEFRSTMDLNLFAALYTSLEALDHMREQKSGDIIQISSTSSRRVGSIFTSYAASKFALNATSWGLREEASRHGVRVCVVEPGATNSGIAEQLNDPNAAKFMAAHTQSETAMLPEDVADAILCVVSLPQRTNVQELLIRPTADGAPI